MAEARQRTINRPDDRRLKRPRTGVSANPVLDEWTTGVHRLDFRKPDEDEAYYAAKALRRLSPQQCKRVRQTIEKTLTADTTAQAEAFLGVMPTLLSLDKMTTAQRIDLVRQLEALQAADLEDTH